MKFLIFLGLYLIAVSAESYIGHAVHEDYPDKCYFNETSYAMDRGEVYTPVGICQKLTCQDDFNILVNSCQKYEVPSECKSIPGDETKVFPGCCVKLECTDADGKSTIRETTFSF